MNRTIVIWIFIGVILSGCAKSNLLSYKDQPYYKEINVIANDSIFTLFQNVCYNNPAYIDEEHCYSLTLIFLDTAAAFGKKKLNLKSDTNIVKVEYSRYSIWDFGSESKRITGDIEIIRLDSAKVQLVENITVRTNSIGVVKRFKGVRVFNENTN